MVTLAPGEQLPVAANGRTVGAPTGYISDVLALKAVNHLWTVIAPARITTHQSMITRLTSKSDDNITCVSVCTQTHTNTENSLCCSMS